MPPLAVHAVGLVAYDFNGCPVSVGVEAAGVVVPGFIGTCVAAAGGVPGPVAEMFGPMIWSWVDAATVITHGPR